MSKYEVIVITGTAYIVEADSPEEAEQTWASQEPVYTHISSVDVNQTRGA
jgi:hypothetical protein